MEAVVILAFIIIGYSCTLMKRIKLALELKSAHPGVLFYLEERMQSHPLWLGVWGSYMHRATSLHSTPL